MTTRLAFALPLFLALVSGCGSGEDAIEGARNQPNHFAGVKNPVDDFSSGSTGDSSNTSGLASNEVRITLELPTALAPDGEATRRNLRIVQPERIAIYRTDPSLQNLGGVDGVSTRTDAEGYTIITFEGGQPLAPDIVIEASYGNTRLRALASDSDRDIKINPFSEYLVQDILGSYTPGEWQAILDCADDERCLNRYVWPTLSDQIHDFEIDIPDNAGLTEALALLRSRADFTRYAQAMAGYALLENTSSGQLQASSADYNAVFLGIELGQSFAEPSIQGAGFWGIRTAQEERLQDDTGLAYVYPALTLASFDAFGIQVTSLASDIPYDREVILQTAGNDFFVRGSDQWQRNTHATAPGAATLAEGTRLLAGRSLYQSVTGRGSSRIIGWTRNPYYLDAYTRSPINTTAGPDRVLAGYFSAGKALELSAQGDQLKRGTLLENHYVSALELDLSRPPTGATFDPEVLHGKDYNVLLLSGRFDQTQSTPITLAAGLGTWSIDDDGGVAQNLALNYLTRDTSGAVSRQPGTDTQQWRVSSRTAILSSGNQDIGRLNLDQDQPSGNEAQPDIGIGASTPDGTLLAFNLDDSPLGDGLLIAARTADTPAPTSGRFRLQGVTLGMADGVNRLRHFADLELVIDSGSRASITGEWLSVTHRVSDQTLEQPDSQPFNLALSYTDNGNGRVSLSNGTLHLDGFFSTDRNQLFLRQADSDDTESLGLLLATRQP